ncbi:MAG: carboxypeptidase regulatory-like domain-containing protein [Patescibacteria group bacterium]
MNERGMTLIEVVVGVALITIVFMGIFTAFQLSVDLVFSTKAKAGALSLLTEKMEIIRSLPYDSLGTVGGIPTGSIPQVATSSLNNIQYTITTLIQYVDAPEDGTGGADTNTITADYKLIKIEAFWSVRGSGRTTQLVTRVAPTGVESLTAGGTLRVNVFDAAGAPVPQASVRILNASTTPTIDLTVNADDTGAVIIPGTPVAANYHITATKSGYSSAHTYAVSGTVPNPAPGNVAVADKQTTTVSLAIDTLGSLAVHTITPILGATSTGAFVDAHSATTAPSYLATWGSASWDTDVVQLYSASGGVLALIPDSDVPGNSLGLTSPVSLTNLSTTTYPALVLVSSTSTAWTLTYTAGPTPVPSVPLVITSSKTIGTDGSGQPVAKYTAGSSTDSSADWIEDPIEWDAYDVALGSGSGYDLAGVCPTAPSVSPGALTSITLTLLENTTNTLRVIVTASSTELDGASVRIEGVSTDETKTTSCGQVFFSGLTSGTYTVTVSKTGYQTVVDNAVGVSGVSLYTVTLSP